MIIVEFRIHSVLFLEGCSSSDSIYYKITYIYNSTTVCYAHDNIKLEVDCKHGTVMSAGTL